MVVRLEKIVSRIDEIDRDVVELQRLKSRVPANRRFTDSLIHSFEAAINDLLNEKISLEELEIEDPPEDLIQDIMSVDVATASRISIDRGLRESEPSSRERKLIDFLRILPKTEIHLHMEACISKDTLASMLEKNQVSYDPAELDKLYQFSNLQEFIKLYLFILDAIKKPDDFELIFQNLRSYLESNNIHYAEVFLAPSRMIQNGLDFMDISAQLDQLSRECRLTNGPDVKFMIDVSRTFGPENASKNLQRVIQAKASSIIGIGLGGAELMGPAREFGDVFAQARSQGLHAVCHAGEDDGPWSVRDSVEILKADRIGHGTSAIQDLKLLDLLKDRRTPIEICLTSNIYTGKYVRREEDHPVRRYYDDGLVCCINTDDPEIFNVTLTDEYFKLYKHLDFTVTEIVDLIRQGIFASFHSDPARLWKSYQKEIESLRRTHNF